MDAAKRIDELLKQDGAVLVRQRKHLVYRLSNNRTFITAKTHSDIHGPQNSLRDLSELLGMEPTPIRSHGPRVRRVKVKGTKRHQILIQEPGPVLESFQRKFLRAGYSPPEIEPHAEARFPVNERHKAEKPKCFSYPPEILAEASRIQASQGHAAYNAFLKQHRDEATEVQKVRKDRGFRVTQETTLEATMEVRVTLARKHVSRLHAEIETTKKKIEQYHQNIAEAEQAITRHIDTIKHLQDFLGSYEILQIESKVVDEVTTPLEKIAIQDRKRAPRGTLSYNAVLEEARHLLTAKTGASFSELFTLMGAKVPGLRHSQMHSAIQHLLKENKLSKIGQGRGVHYILVLTKTAAA